MVFALVLRIISLGKRYSKQRLESACKRAMHVKAFSYKSIKSILEKNLDSEVLSNNQPALPLIEHSNIRGNQYYQSKGDVK